MSKVTGFAMSSVNTIILDSASQDVKITAAPLTTGDIVVVEGADTYLYLSHTKQLNHSKVIIVDTVPVLTCLGIEISDALRFDQGLLRRIKVKYKTLNFKTLSDNKSVMSRLMRRNVRQLIELTPKKGRIKGVANLREYFSERYLKIKEKVSA